MIEFKNVSYSYNVVDADGNAVDKGGVSNINLTIADGEFVVLTGGSGCGKTTITRMINGLIPQYYKYEIAKNVGSVFQNPRSQFFNVNTTDEIAFAS